MCGGFAAGNRDKAGRWLFTVALRNARPAEVSPEEVMRGFHCVLEDLLRKHPEAQARGISLVVDLRDVGFANMDARIPKVLMPAMQSRLPVRLGRLRAIRFC